MDYYVDSISGSDSSPGTPESKPWRTLAPVHAQNFLPGDVVSFKRGSSWTGGLTINDSGVEGNPITFTTYGTGDRPVFTNPGSTDNWTSAVTIKADWVTVEGLLVRDAHYAGVRIQTSADNNIIRDIEATQVGMGIAIRGQHNLVTRSHFHHFTMVVNTPGGDDDFGGCAVWLFNSYNEISYNTMTDCTTPCFDYDICGSAIQWWGDAEGNYIHHNWASRNNSFLEIGGGSANNTIIAYNVTVNNNLFSCIHLTGIFASTIENFRVENNTIIENDAPGWVLFEFLNADPAPGTFSLRNNIIYVDRFWHVSNKSSFTHDHNLYYLSGWTELGFPLGQGEQIADPLFADLAGGDFHLQPGSPARAAGIWLGHEFDFVGNTVTDPPDLGAYQYQEETEMNIVEMLRAKAIELRTMADEIDVAADTLAAIDVTAEAAVVEAQEALEAVQAVEEAL